MGNDRSFAGYAEKSCPGFSRSYRGSSRSYRDFWSSYLEPSDEGPPRRYYGITESGRADLAHARDAWAEFSAVIDSLLETRTEVAVS